MLLVRNEQFYLVNNEYYIVGSSSNLLYDCNEYTMGKFELLSWNVSHKNYDVSKLEKYQKHENIKIIINDDRLSFFKKCKVIKKSVKNTDIVVAKLSIIDALISAHYARKYKKTLVIESASDALAAFWYHGGITYKLAALPLNILARHYHRKADYIIYVSQQFLQKKYPSKKAVSIGCPDIVLEKTPQDVLDKRIKRINSNTGFVVGLIGATQAEYRGHDTLIKAVGLLNKKGLDIKIKFLGGGTKDSKRLKCAKINNIEDKIEFCGRLPRDQVFGWLDEIDALAMPTKVESLGRAALEGMSRGCPVIGTKETALKEVVRSDFLIKANDYKKLASILENVFINKEYAIDIANYNFVFAKNFTKEVVMNKRKDFYSRIKGNKK